MRLVLYYLVAMPIVGFLAGMAGVDRDDGFPLWLVVWPVWLPTIFINLGRLCYRKLVFK